MMKIEEKVTADRWVIDPEVSIALEGKPTGRPRISKSGKLAVIITGVHNTVIELRAPYKTIARGKIGYGTKITKNEKGAVAMIESKLKVYQLDTLTELGIFEMQSSPAYSWKTTYGNKLVVHSRSMLVFDLETRALLMDIKPSTDTLEEVVRYSVFNSDDKLATLMSTGVLRVWDSRTGSPLLVLHETGRVFKALKFSKGKKYLILQDQRNNFEIRDTENYTAIASLAAEGHFAKMPTRILCTSASYMIVRRNDKAVESYELPSLARRGCICLDPDLFDDMFDPIGTFRFLANENYFIAHSFGGLKICKSRGMKEVAVLRTETSYSEALATAQSGNLVVFAGNDKTVKIWNLENLMM